MISLLDSGDIFSFTMSTIVDFVFIGIHPPAVMNVFIKTTDVF